MPQSRRIRNCFKQVNGTHGHDDGGFLLSTIGQRLRTVTRIKDMVARLGGDEFAVAQTGMIDKHAAEEFASRIVTVLGAPLYFKEQELHARVTVGVALAPDDGAIPERLLKSANLALYNGKQQRRGCVRFFEPEMSETLQKRIELERTIRDAIEHAGFEVHYQPVFEMDNKRLVGFEALARLKAPDGTVVSPAAFIPLAEELRLIDRIGSIVLGGACRTATTWPDRLSVAVNLSAAQFASGKLEETVAAALRRSGLAPHRLEAALDLDLVERELPQIAQPATAGG